MPKLLGREPTLWIAFIAAALSLAAAFNIPGLSPEQAAAIIVVLNAVLGAVNALLVRPVSPAAFTYLVASAATLVGAYGVHLSQEQVGLVNTVVLAGLALMLRGQCRRRNQRSPAVEFVRARRVSGSPEMGDGEMPKEIIHHPDAPFSVEVNWHRDASHVQIASVTRPVEGNTPLPLAELIEKWDDDSKQLATGLFCTLDRHHINRLIRVLRRARDQAFGRDE